MQTLIGLGWPFVSRFWSYGALAVVSALAWHFDARAVANVGMVRAQAASFAAAQAAAKQIAQTALQHEQATYQAKATEADNAYQTQLAAARTAADSYSALHRVRAEAVASGAGATVASAQGGSAGIPASLPANAVMVSAGDVQTCSDAVTYALAAHDWAGTINP